MIKLILNDISPISVNDAHDFNHRKKRVFTSGKVQVFKNEFSLKLLKYKKLLHDFQGVFFQAKHALAIKYECQLPKKKLMTKKGTISLISGDAGNFEKIMTDTLFKFMPSLNDAQILSNHTIKTISKNDKPNIIIHLSIMDIPESWFHSYKEEVETNLSLPF